MGAQIAQSAVAGGRFIAAPAQRSACGAVILRMGQGDVLNRPERARRHFADRPGQRRAVTEDVTG